MKCNNTLRRSRRGNVIVLSAVLMVTMMAMIAFAVDLGYLYNARTEMQRAADASAIAACWELIDEDVVKGTSNTAVISADARSKARQFVALNKINQVAVNLANDDITVGYIAQPGNPSSPFLSSGYSAAPNAVKLRIRRTAEQNGAVPLFFGPVLGVQFATLQLDATAAYLPGISGFKAPSDGSTLGILPYALDQGTWTAMLAGGGSDSYRFTDDSGSVSSGSDGIREVNLFPQGTGSPGNRGTVDIGGSNNSTSDIARQIVHGISGQDMAQMPGGKLQFDSSGKLYLNGDTGISAGVKDELASIIGETRIIPIFSSVSGNGNNATYTIVKFVGVRVMYVKLTGSNKQVIVQPAVCVTRGGIQDSSFKSDFVYSPVWLVR
jgi:hypothetical protein